MKILGIDLGGCMSGNSAYLLSEGSADAFDIHEAFKEPKHRDHISCGNYLHDVIVRTRPDAIAVDAPLSLPAALLGAEAPGGERIGSGEICNPYLFRYTDYFLFKTYGLRPMPPAGDRIGRLTARAIALLQRLEYSDGCLHVNGTNIPIFEVYPRQVADALKLNFYKSEPARLFEALHVSPESYDEHLLDALLCCYAGFKIMQGDTFLPPSDVIAKEGWCYPVVQDVFILG